MEQVSSVANTEQRRPFAPLCLLPATPLIPLFLSAAAAVLACCYVPQVRELLATDISEASEALAVVSTPSTAAAEAAFQHKLGNAGAGAGGVGSPKAQQQQQPTTAPSSPSKYVEFDSSSIRLLLHSIDEVLRRGESHDFFKGIPQEKLENMMASVEPKRHGTQA
jgi:hypothetical protein